MHSSALRYTLALAAVLFLAGCNGGTVDRHALSQDSDAIDSLACEGALLAADVADGRTTTIFARVHAGELAQAASNFEDALSQRPTLRPIERAVRARARKAGRVSALLDRLAKRPGDESAAEVSRRALEQAGGCA
jgi:hypothetical protein